VGAAEEVPELDQTATVAPVDPDDALLPRSTARNQILITTKKPLARFFRLSFFGPGLFCFWSSSFLAARPEFLHASRGVEQFFLASVERMTLAANVHLYLGLGRSDGERRSATADDFGFGKICGVKFGFHNGVHYI
jgi:hypothetical protein